LVAWPSSAGDSGVRCALFEPFDKTQDRLREFARRRSRRTAQGYPKGHATAYMVLGPFAETKGPRRMGTKPHRILKVQVDGFPIKMSGKTKAMMDPRLRTSGMTERGILG
ncbi:MAG: hypothetical protein QNK38_02650, partial [Nitrospirota bacterium]|nr:hypothetical protein [Nitrospirota bacterium]MDX2419957.1 hypothetical protein [Nitrospirota bacterium]